LRGNHQGGEGREKRVAVIGLVSEGEKWAPPPCKLGEFDLGKTKRGIHKTKGEQAEKKNKGMRNGHRGKDEKNQD